MKKLKKKIIPVLFALAVCCFAMAGCKSGFDPIKKGFTATVYYEANGGVFEGTNGRTERVFRYKPDSIIIEPGNDKSGAQVPLPTRSGHHVSGWYKAETDENGAPVKNGDEFVLASEEWDFASDRAGGEGSVIYLVAGWSKNYKFTVDVGDAARAAGVDNIVNDKYSKAGPVSIPGIEPEWEGHTFYYYEDAEHNRLTATDWENLIISDENPDITVYVKWLDGVWKIVNDKDGLTNMISANYWIDDDIDFGTYQNGVLKSKGKFSGVQNFSGKFEGNGHVIKNFVYETSVMGKTAVAGVFTFRSGGYVRNVKFQNCEANITLKVNNDFVIGFLGDGSRISDLTLFTDLVFNGCTLTVIKTMEAVSVSPALGEGTGYYGVFGKIKDGESFSIDDADRDITVTVTTN